MIWIVYVVVVVLTRNVGHVLEVVPSWSVVLASNVVMAAMVARQWIDSDFHLADDCSVHYSDTHDVIRLVRH